MVLNTPSRVWAPGATANDAVSPSQTVTFTTSLPVQSMRPWISWSPATTSTATSSPPAKRPRSTPSMRILYRRAVPPNELGTLKTVIAVTTSDCPEEASHRTSAIATDSASVRWFEGLRAGVDRDHARRTFHPCCPLVAHRARHCGGIAAFVVVGVLLGQPAWQELIMGVVVLGLVQVITLRGRRR